MNEHLRKDVRELREQVKNAEYHVDSQAVADAIVRRRWAVTVGTRRARSRVIAASRWNRPEVLAA